MKSRGNRALCASTAKLRSAPIRGAFRRAFGGVFKVALAMIAAVLAIGLAAREARAEVTSDARARADEVLRKAEADDEALAFDRALEGYDHGRALDPGSPRAPRAETRAATLRAHAEGAFAPFVKLERLRRSPELASDPRAVDALASEAESFPPGLVRIEVWVLAAEAYAHRFGRPADAEALLRRVLSDASGASGASGAGPAHDPVLTRKAARDLVTLQLARGDRAGAEATVQLAGDRADPQLARDVQRSARRHRVHVAAIALLVGLLALAGRAVIAAVRSGAGAAVRAAVARTARVAAAYAAYVAIGGALLASGYQAGTSKPFLYNGLVLLPLLLVARAWGAAGGATFAARSGRAVVCAAAAMGAAFLVVEAVDVAYLEGVGL